MPSQDRYELDPEGVLRAAEGLFPGAVDGRAVGHYGCVVLALLQAPKKRGRGMTLRQCAAYWRGGFEALRARFPTISEYRERLFVLVATGPEEVDALAAAWAMAREPTGRDADAGYHPGWEAVRPLLEQPHRAGRLLSATARF